MASKQIKQNSSIAIVGGSLTGPALALLLLKAGFEDVSVYEALAETIPQAGGVIGLDHLSLGILDGIGIDQEEIVPFASERVVSVKVLDRQDANRVRQLWPGRNTTWNLLHAALMRQLPSGVFHPSRRVVGLDKSGLLSFADGDPVKTDFVAFADGRRSIGRKLFDPRPMRYAGYIAHRGQGTYESEDIQDFVRYEPGNSQFNVFPVPLPNGEIGLDWTFYLRASAAKFREAFGGEPTVRTFITSRQIHEPMRVEVNEAAERLLPEAQADLVQRTVTRAALPILDISAPHRMAQKVGENMAVLIGDALAPVRPHTGRGANNGIDEAAGLALALTQSGRFDADLRTALGGWQSRYLPLVANALRRGPEIGRALGL